MHTYKQVIAISQNDGEA